jgi:hypothetical protein
MCIQKYNTDVACGQIPLIQGGVSLNASKLAENIKLVMKAGAQYNWLR